MSGRLRITCTISVMLMMAFASLAHGFPRFARETKMSCATCHSKVSGGPDLTDAGKAFKADSSKVPAASAEGAEYVSNRKCRVCHLKEYKSWLETPHAKALDALKTATPEKIAEMAKRAGVTLEGSAADNPACLQCHVTGYKLDGGFPAADSLKNVALAAVTCESCHGPGSKHVGAEKAVKKNFINRQITAALCMQCHTPEMSPKFDFAEYKVKGVHAIPKPEP